MFEIEKLTKVGIHEVFDTDLTNSYVIKDKNNVLGYVLFHERENEKTIWVEYIQAERRGRGDGQRMLQALFSLGYNRIEGTAIHGPHFFWEDVGPVFLDKVSEDHFDGTYFYLTKEGFDKKSHM